MAGRSVSRNCSTAVCGCEFRPTMIHAKTLTIDGVWSSVGSVNFDNRSFQLQDEVTLGICSREFAGAARRAVRARPRALLGDRPGALERPLVPARATEAITRLARREL